MQKSPLILPGLARPTSTVTLATVCVLFGLGAIFAQTVNPPHTSAGSPTGAQQGIGAFPPGVRVLSPNISSIYPSSSGVVMLSGERGRLGDLNGDGDTGDGVYTSYDFAAQSLSTSGAAQAFICDMGYGGSLSVPRVEGDTVITKTEEFFQGGMDLNGDGDAFDILYYFYDASTGTTAAPFYTRPDVSCSGSAAVDPTVDIEGPWAAVQASENGTDDLNSDGDMDDNSHILVHVPTGAVINPGLSGRGSSATRATLGDDLALLPVSEQEQGNTDFNGNGSSTDIVAFIVDLQTSEQRLIPMSVTQGTESRVAPVPGGFVFGAGEFGTGDLNQDGDTSDLVLQAYDHATGLVTNLGVAVAEVSRGLVGSKIRVQLDEVGQGQDFNGDGDTLDSVLGLYDTADGTLSNTGMAATRYAGMSGSRLLYFMDEASQGATDRNGDGDALDWIPVLLDDSTGSITVFPVAVNPFTLILREDYLQGEFVLLPVWEFGQGGADLNGDGDAFDNILFGLDLETMSAFQAPYAMDQLRQAIVADGLIFYDVSETASGSVDLNGDGSVRGALWMAFDLATGTSKSLDLGAYDPAVAFDGQLVLIGYEGLSGLDLNLDGIVDTGSRSLIAIDPSKF